MLDGVEDVGVLCDVRTWLGVEDETAFEEEIPKFGWVIAGEGCRGLGIACFWQMQSGSSLECLE